MNVAKMRKQLIRDSLSVKTVITIPNPATSGKIIVISDLFEAGENG